MNNSLESVLQGTADSIREKLGIQDELSPYDFEQRILDISTGDTDIYRVDTIEERDELENINEGDHCLVSSTSLGNITSSYTGGVISFPESIEVDVSEDVNESLEIYSFMGMGNLRVQLSINSGYADIYFEGHYEDMETGEYIDFGMIQYSYDDSTHIFTLINGPQGEINFEDVECSYDGNQVNKFIQTISTTFTGLYVYKSGSWEYAFINTNLYPSRVFSGDTYYSNSGFQTGTFDLNKYVLKRIHYGTAEPASNIGDYSGDIYLQTLSNINIDNTVVTQKYTSTKTNTITTSANPLNINATIKDIQYYDDLCCYRANTSGNKNHYFYLYNFTNNTCTLIKTFTQTNNYSNLGSFTFIDSNNIVILFSDSYNSYGQNGVLIKVNLTTGDETVIDTTGKAFSNTIIIAFNKFNNCIYILGSDRTTIYRYNTLNNEFISDITLSSSLSLGRETFFVSEDTIVYRSSTNVWIGKFDIENNSFNSKVLSFYATSIYYNYNTNTIYGFYLRSISGESRHLTAAIIHSYENITIKSNKIDYASVSYTTDNTMSAIIYGSSLDSIKLIPVKSSSDSAYSFSDISYPLYSPINSLVIYLADEDSTTYISSGLILDNYKMCLEDFSFVTSNAPQVNQIAKVYVKRDGRYWDLVRDYTTQE